jgi:ActR/RegA family two-component response regulator
MLVVDDEAPVLFALGRFFGSFGFAVDAAREREEAEALLSRLRYAVVISDLRLSATEGREGFEIISFVRAQSLGTRIVVLTAYGSSAVAQEAYRRGADAVVPKPTPLIVLRDLVFELLGERP